MNNIKLQPSWLGKINYSNGCKVNKDENKDKTKDETKDKNIENINSEPQIYHGKINKFRLYDETQEYIETIPKFSKYPTISEYAYLSYKISAINKYLLGYRDFYRYYLRKPVIRNKMSSRKYSEYNLKTDWDMFGDENNCDKGNDNDGEDDEYISDSNNYRNDDIFESDNLSS
jgi:hypothetical protein